MRSWPARARWLRGAPHALGLGVFCAQVALGVVLFAVFQEFAPNGLGAGDAFGGYLLSFYGGARFLSETPAGAISDRIPRTRALLLGFALMLPALALMAVVREARAYLAFAALLGVSTAFIWPAAYALGADRYAPAERGKVVGFLNVGQLLGFGLGALAGALLVEAAPDALFGLALAAVAAALLTTRAGVGGAARGDAEARTRRIPKWREAFPARLLFLGALILAATVGISSLLPAIRPYGDDVLGVSFARLTLLLLPALAAGALLYVPAGHLSDRIGRTRPLLLAQLLIVAGALAVAATASIPLAMIAAAVIFAGQVLQVPALNAAVMDLAPPSRRGALIGWSVALSGLGLAIGPAIGGVVTEALGAPAAFRVTAALAAGAALLTLAYGRVYGHAPPAESGVSPRRSPPS